MVDALTALRGHPRYQVIETLGKGDFAEVVRAADRQTTAHVAIKCIRVSRLKTLPNYIQAELENHALLSHPNVIQYKGVFQCLGWLCIVMEFAAGGTLLQYVLRHENSCLPEDVALHFFQQLMIAVDYCHSRGSANRDIKLENILLQSVAGASLPVLKLCDFGYSKGQTVPYAQAKVGTEVYMAPEALLAGAGDAASYNRQLADIWSCGIVLYAMLYGMFPFNPAEGVVQVVPKMIHRDYPRPSNILLSAGCQNLLDLLLTAEPNERITIAGIFKHPWFLRGMTAQTLGMNALWLRSSGHLPEPETLNAIRQVLYHAMS